MTKERLQKVMASAGVASRRQCEELIVEGAVRVNGRVVDELPAFVDPDADLVTVHGRRLEKPHRVYFLLNKPKGVICTSDDPFGRPKVVDLVDCRERVFCIGRLDADTTGLIILTNDAELANLLTHPKYKVPKTYVVTVTGRVDGMTVERLKKGIWLAEGKTARASVRMLRSGHRASLLEITIRQGLNRQIRRMLAKVGMPVKSLRRTRIGGLRLEALGAGKYRPLSKAEVASLRRAATEHSKRPQSPPRHKKGTSR